MAHNPELIPKKHPFNKLFGQNALTRFCDYRKSIKVDLIKYDDPAEMLKGTYDFVKATWSLDGKESERASEDEMRDALKQMLSGKALGLGIETVNFMFRISGITRIDTHQIVRQRIGVTFSQMCSGDQWWSHRDCLVEESIAQDPILLKEYISATLAGKNTYVNMIDSMKVSIQAAREILPQNLDTFIFMNVNLATLLFFHQKRIDDGSQTWSINIIAQQMADEVCRVFPDLTETFEKNKTKFKFQKEASADRTNTFSTSLYIPKDDDFEYHTRDFLYPMKKKEMHFTNTPIEDRYYWGEKEVEKGQFYDIKAAYSALDYQNSKEHLTNEEIYQRAQETNKQIEETF